MSNVKEMENAKTGVTKTVEIDCAPGCVRPDTYFRSICDKLSIEYMEPVGKFFGNWTWIVRDLTEEQAKVYDEFVPDYLKGLYQNGYIRYASW